MVEFSENSSRIRIKGGEFAYHANPCNCNNNLRYGKVAIKAIRQGGEKPVKSIIVRHIGISRHPPYKGRVVANATSHYNEKLH